MCADTLYLRAQATIRADGPPSAQAREPFSGTQMSDPGVYCLRSNETAWTPEQLWRTYVTLTDLEAVFRSLKSELGLRPIFHHEEARSGAHLFIAVLAYQFVQAIRTRLADRGIHDGWDSLRKILRVQRRVTSSFKTREGASYLDSHNPARLMAH